MSYSSPGLLTDESRWLAKIVRQQAFLQHAITAAEYPFSLTFTIGDGNPGTPIAGTDTYTNAALVAQMKVYRNGVLLHDGVDYTHVSGSFVLVSPDVFVTDDVYIVLYL